MAEEPVITSAVSNAPGWITIAWAHSGQDGVVGYRLERQNPPAAWTSNNHLGIHTDMGLQPSTVYAYRVCAVYAGEPEACTDWVSVTTMAPEQAPPPSDRTPPTLTAHEVTQTGITIKWSGRKHDRVHILWRKATPGSSQQEAQIDIDHEGREGFRHFPNLEIGTPYTFRIQGVSLNVFGTAIAKSHWSAPPIQISTIGPTLPTPPTRVAPIYVVMPNNDLTWNRHEGHQDGSFLWASDHNRTVGSGWNVLQAFSGGEGIVYAVMHNGDLKWNRHEGREDGTPRWASPNGITVGTGWNAAAHVFAGHQGVIYAVYNDGRVIWNRHDGRQDGTFRWALATGQNVANSVNKMVFWRAAHVFAGGGPGVIYAIMDDGDLLWFRHDGWWDGSARWTGDDGKTVGVGWQVVDAFGLRDTSYIYAVMPNGDLMWNRHDGHADGTFRWASGDRNLKVGHGWSVRHAFSG